MNPQLLLILSSGQFLWLLYLRTLVRTSVEKYGILEYESFPIPIKQALVTMLMIFLTGYSLGFTLLVNFVFTFLSWMAVAVGLILYQRFANKRARNLSAIQSVDTT